MIRPINVEELRRRALTSVPFPHVVLDEFLDPDFARQVHDAFPPFAEALRLGRSFKTVNEKKKVQVTDPATFAPPVRELHRQLASPAWIGVLSGVFDIPELLADPELAGGGMHQTGSRGRLDVHVDFNYIAERQLHRRLNAILYLNPDWPVAWGGQLELWDPNVRRCLQTVDPVFNRCVVFETTSVSYHGVTAVNCPEDRTRKSFATYYYTREAPPRGTGEAHDTIFRSRPDEFFRGHVLMPVERAGRRLRQRVEDLRWKIKGML